MKQTTTQTIDARTFTCPWCGWNRRLGLNAGGCCLCYMARRVIEARKNRRVVRVWRDRLGRRLPTDAMGCPVCPRCGESDRVEVTIVSAVCGRCGSDVRFVKPRKYLPDF